MAIRLVTAALMAPSALGSAQQRKHVLMILADDYGWADSGWHRQDAIGRQEVLTPTMDRLIKEGLELDRHCASSPIACSTHANTLVAFASHCAALKTEQTPTSSAALLVRRCRADATQYT
eukprot:COSAG02_NODE_3857_length_6138_cov_4.966220_3_plen_120_part_00